MGDILKSPAPDPDIPITTAVWHFARGMAYASTGDVSKVESERNLFTAARNRIPKDATWDLNSADSIMNIAQLVLKSRIARAKGDDRSTIELLGKAVKAEDALNYTEPPSWYIPVRESLGGVLFLNGDYSESEKVFRTDLERNPRSGRSLFGLYESLRAQGKNYEALLVKGGFEAAWKNSDTKLKMEHL